MDLDKLHRMDKRQSLGVAKILIANIFLWAVFTQMTGELIIACLSIALSLNNT